MMHGVKILVAAVICLELAMQSQAMESQRPPPSDAVFDVRSACLYGHLEGDQISTKDRIAACDEWGKLETRALNAGFCWNQMEGRYRPCKAH